MVLLHQHAADSRQPVGWQRWTMSSCVAAAVAAVPLDQYQSATDVMLSKVKRMHAAVLDDSCCDQ